MIQQTKIREVFFISLILLCGLMIGFSLSSITYKNYYESYYNDKYHTFYEDKWIEKNKFIGDNCNCTDLEGAGEFLGKDLSFHRCYGEDVIESSECLIDYVKTFYNYSAKSDEFRTLEEIKGSGGDCYDYANLYKRMAIELGFNATTFSFFGDDLGHRVTFVWDRDLKSYCFIDQLHSECLVLKEREK
jgi:hypothetical protein